MNAIGWQIKKKYHIKNNHYKPIITKVNCYFGSGEFEFNNLFTLLF